MIKLDLRVYPPSVNVVLTHIVTLANGQGGSISKCHNVFQYNADAAAGCVCSLNECNRPESLLDLK